MPLPNPCAKGAATGGTWAEAEAGGFERCDCPRGRALVWMAVEPEPRDPVLGSGAVTIFVEMMAAMDWFPPEAGARMAIGEEIRSMCADEKQALWLVTRMNRLYTKWPGIQELRRVYCASGRRPLDAVAALGESTVYPEGIPAEGPQARPAAAVLTAGPSRDPEMRRLVGEVAEKGF